jgi:TolB-like protein/DNA-binding winged helix-turn-helix (wHTH) protein/Tfp pilus assembly protein PilF
MRSGEPVACAEQQQHGKQGFRNVNVPPAGFFHFGQLAAIPARLHSNRHGRNQMTVRIGIKSGQIEIHPLQAADLGDIHIREKRDQCHLFLGIPHCVEHVLKLGKSQRGQIPENRIRHSCQVRGVISGIDQFLFGVGEHGADDATNVPNGLGGVAPGQRRGKDLLHVFRTHAGNSQVRQRRSLARLSTLGEQMIVAPGALQPVLTFGINKAGPMLPREQVADKVLFGCFEVNLTTGEFFREGRKVALSGQPAQVLVVLLQRAGQLVTREELRLLLWPDETFVDFDHGLNNSINRIRDALGDSATSPLFIQTLPKKGYRFIGEIGSPEERTSFIGTDADSPTKASNRRRLIWIGAAMAVAACIAGTYIVFFSLREATGNATSGITSLAVLPMENLSGDPEQDFFADGMTDELITIIAKSTPLRVISRTSVMSFKGSRARQPVKAIARALDVDAIVEGSVIRDGNHVRITAQLIDARVDKHLWAESYEGDLKDVLALQSDVATAISKRLQLTLNPQWRIPIVKPPGNPAAHEAYLRGKYSLNKRTVADLKKSEQYFQQAIELDPGDASAYAGLAEAYQIQGSWEGGMLPPKEAFPKAIAAAERALHLDNTLPDAHEALGYSKLYYSWDWAGAENDLKTAIALNPSSEDAHHWYSHYLLSVGNVADSLMQSQRAIQVAPVDPLMNVHLAWHYLYARNYDEAIEQSRTVQRMDVPVYGGYLFGGWALEQQGKFSEAIDWFKKGVALSGHIMYCRSALGHAYGVSGDKAHARRVLKELKALATRQYVPSYDIAIVYLGLGDKEEAYRWLQKALDERSAWMVYLNMDPRLDNLRSESRFKKLVREVGLPDHSG